jgi:peptide/nickel transport system substrate-binding protein
LIRWLLFLLSIWAAPVQAQELRIGVNTLPASLGNPFKGNGRPGSLVWSQLFDGLTQLDARGALAPALATSWQRTAPTVWRFQLRPGVRFANGKPFDAAAAARVLTWLSSKDGRKTVIGNELRGVASAAPVGPLTLEVITKGPDPILPRRMIAAMMVEPDHWAKLGPDAFALAPIGTGPMQLDRWDQQARRALTSRNPHGWRRSVSARMTFIELPDAAVRTQALLSEDVDIAAIEIEESDRLKRRGVKLVHAPAMATMSIAFINQRRTPGPLQDVRVRQALNFAVNKEPLARVLLQGLTVPSGQPAPRGTIGHDPALRPYAYDPAKARALLAAAGYAKGFPLLAEIQINAFPADSLIYQSVAHDLRQVGVDLTLKVIPFPQYLKNLAGNLWRGDAFGAMWNNAPYNDATRPMESFSCKRPKPFFCDQSLAADLDAASKILDEPKRQAAFRALSRRYHEAAPALFLVEQIDLIAYAPRLQNVVLKNRVPAFEDIRFAKDDRL